MFNIILNNQQKQELSEDVYHTVKSAIQQARNGKQHTKPYLNKKKMCQWLGIAPHTLNKWILNGLPVANMVETYRKSNCNQIFTRS